MSDLILIIAGLIIMFVLLVTISIPVKDMRHKEGDDEN